MVGIRRPQNMQRPFVQPKRPGTLSRAQVKLKRSELLMDIQDMAKARLDAKGAGGKLSTNDVQALMARAYHKGHVTKKDCEDLNQVKKDYKDRMEPDAYAALDAFTSTWLAASAAQIAEDNAKAAQKLAERAQKFDAWLADEQRKDINEDVKVDRKELTERLKDLRGESSEKEVAVLTELFGHAAPVKTPKFEG